MISFLPAALFLISQTTPAQTLALGVLVNDDVYLGSLRESDMGCGTILVRRPQAIVIGDSHSYAAWNFVVLQRELHERIGACAFGGMYIETVLPLLHVIASISPTPAHIILGTSPRMFWEAANKPEQIKVHETALKNLHSDLKPFYRHFFLGTALPNANVKESLALHRSSLVALSEDQIVSKLSASHSTIMTLRDWDMRLRAARVSPAANTIKGICEQIQKMKVRFTVVHIPESPYLESQYPPSLWARYQQDLEQFRACTTELITATARDYGLSNRHFVDRLLVDDAGYASWSTSGPLRNDRAFDADHMNPLGAEVFTSALSAMLNKSNATR